MSKSYRDLLAWQKAMELTESVYKASQSWPSDERYGLTNQARRAPVSIPANIAEGQGRSSDRDFLRFLSIANGSLHEVETHLILAQRLDYLPQELLNHLLGVAAEVGRLLHGLSNNLRARLARAPTDY